MLSTGGSRAAVVERPRGQAAVRLALTLADADQYGHAPALGEDASGVFVPTPRMRDRAAISSAASVAIVAATAAAAAAPQNSLTQWEGELDEHDESMDGTGPSGSGAPPPPPPPPSTPLPPVLDAFVKEYNARLAVHRDRVIAAMAAREKLDACEKGRISIPKKEKEKLTALASLDVYLFCKFDPGGKCDPFSPAVAGFASDALQEAVDALQQGDHHITSSTFRSSATTIAREINLQDPDVDIIARWDDPTMRAKYTRFLRTSLDNALRKKRGLGPTEFLQRQDLDLPPAPQYWSDVSLRKDFLAFKVNDFVRIYRAAELMGFGVFGCFAPSACGARLPNMINYILDGINGCINRGSLRPSAVGGSSSGSGNFGYHAVRFGGAAVAGVAGVLGGGGLSAAAAGGAMAYFAGTGASRGCLPSFLGGTAALTAAAVGAPPIAAFGAAAVTASVATFTASRVFTHISRGAFFLQVPNRMLAATFLFRMPLLMASRDSHRRILQGC